MRNAGQHLRTELDRIYDRAFPVRDPGDLADIPDTRWPTVRRTMQLLVLSAPHGCQRASRAPFVAEAVAAGDAALLRLLIVSPVGEFPTEAAVRALDGLYALGVLDATVVEHALLADENLGYAVLGRAPRGADPSASAAAWALREIVPSAVFSEVMRDLDMMVSVAGTGEWRAGSATMAQSRAQLLAALMADLGLDRVTVDGTCAVVHGTRATYRVHLTSGSIHVEPGGYLCVVPTSFGGSAHGRLFLPFADEDRMTSVILSKVLLLNDDEHITDPTILAQLPRYQPVEPGALASAQRLHPLWK